MALGGEEGEGETKQNYVGFKGEEVGREMRFLVNRPSTVQS